jgi:hypothetical protein
MPAPEGYLGQRGEKRVTQPIGQRRKLLVLFLVSEKSHYIFNSNYGMLFDKLYNLPALVERKE